MTRRLALFGPALLWADARQDVLDMTAPLAAALSNGDADDFLARVPADASLETNVRALTAQAEVTSSIQIASLEKDMAELDWYMQIRGRATGSLLERRRGTVKIRFRKHEILSITPADFFKPVEVR